MLLILLRKEIMLIWRNSYMRRLIIMYPIVLATFSPLVTTLDVQNLHVAVIDNDHSELSRLMDADISNSPELLTDKTYTSYSYAMHDLEQGKTDVIAEIPYGFEQQLVRHAYPKDINISGNAVNSVKGSLGSSYVSKTMQSTLKAWMASKGIHADAEKIVSTYEYNETQNYKYYMIPALLTIVILMIGGFLPALNLLEERVGGTIEQVNASPISTAMFMLSKMIPFWGISVIAFFVSVVIAWGIYGMAPVGTFVSIFLAAMLFAICTTNIGCFVANVSGNMLQAMLVMLSVILLMQLMGGLMTPIDSMPEWAQTMTRFIPTRYIIEILRAVFLKGTTIIDMLPSYLAVVAFDILGLLLAFLTYHKRS